MPKFRCKHYWSNGNPFNGGCTAASCRYVHPHEKDVWESLPPYKSNIRCKYFDNDGISTGPCIDGSRHCRFVHPDDPRWAHASPNNFPAHRRVGYPEKHIERIVPATSSSRVEHPAPSIKSNVQSTAEKLSPKLQTDVLDVKSASSALSPNTIASSAKRDPNEKLASLVSPPRTMDTSTKCEGSSIRSNAPVLHLSLQRAPGSNIDLPSPGSVNSPLAPSSAVSQTAAGSRRQTWRKLISTLTRAVNMREKLRHVDRRISLYSVGSASGNAPSESDQLSGFRKDAQNSRKDLQDKLNVILTQLVELDTWPLPQDCANMTRREESTHLEDYEMLTKRLDEVEVQLNECAEVRHLFDKKTVAPASNVDMAERTSRPLKRRRTSSNLFVRISDVQHLMDRLDRAETKISEIVEGEIWNEDNISDTIEELLEIIIQRSALLGRSSPDLLRGDEVSGIEASQNPLKTQIRNLETNFVALCGELAEHIHAVVGLEVEMGRLRQESAALKQNVDSLGSSYGQLRGNLDSLSHKTLDISSNIINRSLIPDTHSAGTFADHRELLIQSVGHDVKQRIATVQDELTNFLASHFKDAQSAITTQVESSIAKPR